MSALRSIWKMDLVFSDSLESTEMAMVLLGKSSMIGMSAVTYL